MDDDSVYANYVWSTRKRWITIPGNDSEGYGNSKKWYSKLNCNKVFHKGYRW